MDGTFIFENRSNPEPRWKKQLNTEVLEACDLPVFKIPQKWRFEKAKFFGFFPNSWYSLGF